MRLYYAKLSSSRTPARRLFKISTVLSPASTITTTTTTTSTAATADDDGGACEQVCPSPSPAVVFLSRAS